MPTIIETTSDLAAFCDALARESYITVDTEFHREKTYYPELCLVQIAGANIAAIIDPLAPDMDLAPLYQLLANPDVLKVMHACRQDMEIFTFAMGRPPAPVFDTQIAGMVLGYGESVSYETLVRHYAKSSLDKSSRFTDWMARPLTQKQLDYALADVTHLRVVFEAMEAELEKQNRNHWLVDDMNALLDPTLYAVKVDDCWQRLKFRQTSPRYLAILQSISRWRELEAQRLNVPRGRLVKDDSLVEIASQKPASPAELRKMRAYQGTLNDSQCHALIAAIQAGLALSEYDCPVWRERKPLADNLQTGIDLLKLLLKKIAGEVNTVPRLIAPMEDLERLILGKRDVSVLQGWREELFGKHAVDLLEGKLTIRYDATKQRVLFETTPT